MYNQMSVKMKKRVKTYTDKLELQINPLSQNVYGKKIIRVMLTTKLMIRPVKLIENENANESETQKWAQSISMRSPQAVTNTKKIMRDSLEKKFIQTYEDEANTQNSIFGNDEFKEGVTAFFEKRKPVFK